MANPEHLAILREGVDKWNKWRAEHRSVHPDLSDASLEGEGLSEVNLSHADLRGTNLRETRLALPDWYRG